MREVPKLSELQLSALAEAGNIGAGHAAIALSQLVGRTIMITITKAQVMPLEEYARIIGGEDMQIVGIYLKVLGDVQGAILLALDRDSAMRLVDVLTSQKIGSTLALDEMGSSALKETGTILSCSYLNALCELMKISLVPSAPNMLEDRTGTVFQSVFGSLPRESNVTIGIETQFIEADTRTEGYFLLMLQLKGLKILLQALGV